MQVAGFTLLDIHGFLLPDLIGTGARPLEVQVVDELLVGRSSRTDTG